LKRGIVSLQANGRQGSPALLTQDQNRLQPVVGTRLSMWLELRELLDLEFVNSKQADNLLKKRDTEIMAIKTPDGKDAKYKVVPLKVKTKADLDKEKESKKKKKAGKK
jgi:hypothetical protein